MSGTATPYKLLIHAILEQQGSFSTGGNRFQERDANLDHVIAKNGKGEYTLRGTGLAGAFIATACQLYNTLPGEISEQSPLEYHKKMKRKFERENSDKEITYEQWLAKQPRMPESLWLFHHAHPLNTPEHSEIRDNVAIRQKTGAAKDGAKFDAETLPAGTQWSFLMEVDQYRDVDNNPVNADSIALNTLQHWQDHGCWLGKDVARGLGYMKLKDIKIYQLTSEHIDRWPDSRKPPCELFQGLSSMTLNEDEQTKLKNKWPPNQNPCIVSGSITIQVGQAIDDGNGYGLDMLSVGGNNGKKQEDKNPGKVIAYPEAMQGKSFLKQHKAKLIKPLGQDETKYLEFSENTSKDIHFNIAVTRKNGTYIPHIPGSAMRGPLRHSLSWLLRKQGQTIWEPAGENNHPASGEEDIVLKLFGSTERSASLLISDALPVDDDWHMLVLEMHAEDEFTQGVFGSGKFDRTCLSKGTFEAHFELQANSEEALAAMKAELEKLNTLGKQQFIPIGGGQWKGLGWIKLAIEFAQAEAETDTRDETEGATA